MHVDDIVSLFEHYSRTCSQVNWGFYATSTAIEAYIAACRVKGVEPENVEVFEKLRIVHPVKYDPKEVKLDAG